MVHKQNELQLLYKKQFASIVKLRLTKATCKIVNKIRKVTANAYSFDIAVISASAFTLNLKKKNNEVFAVSLYKLNKLLEKRKALKRIDFCSIDENENERLVENLVLNELRDLKDIFSKKAFNELLLHRTAVDHKIELTSENTLRHSPLIRLTTKELQTLKNYIIDNLDKSFIASSYALFAALVLFVRKPNGSLRLYIDYRKLNSITCKNQYFFFFIDETLLRLTKAKIFTKLDIRQAFYRIRIHFDSEELTTFRTCYGTYKCKMLLFGLTNGPATY